MEMAEKAINDISAQKEKVISADFIQEVVAKYFNINKRDLKGSKRSNDIAYPRQIAMYLCKELTNKPLKAIGASFGGRDHSTVINACKRIETDMKNDPQVSDLVEDLTKRIKKQ